MEKSVGPNPVLAKPSIFGATTTMATSAAPTPWNCLPPPVDNLRWWHNIFLQFPQSPTFDDLPEEHQQKFLAAAQHGEMHAFHVPPLKPLLSRLDASSIKKADGRETLKTSSFSQPQATHFHCIRHNRLTSPLARTIDGKNTEGYHHPISLPQTIHHVPQHPSKHPDACAANRGTGLLGCCSATPKQQLLVDPQQQGGQCCHSRRHCTRHYSHPIVSDIDDP